MRFIRSIPNIGVANFFDMLYGKFINGNGLPVNNRAVLKVVKFIANS